MLMISYSNSKETNIIFRSASGNSGNVEENKSLYWHPTVYEHSPAGGTYQKDDIFFASTYYIWTTGEATAFPDGFKVRYYAFSECQ